CSENSPPNQTSGQAIPKTAAQCLSRSTQEQPRSPVQSYETATTSAKPSTTTTAARTAAASIASQAFPPGQPPVRWCFIFVGNISMRRGIRTTRLPKGPQSQSLSLVRSLERLFPLRTASKCSTPMSVLTLAVMSLLWDNRAYGG